MNDLVAFGPVPSRRLGSSLGINNIPPKICSYSCVYCQLGRTDNMRVERKVFYDPAELVENVGRKVREAEIKEEQVDYLTFVADGEPTLDINLGTEIEMLGEYGIRIGVITNASLLWREDVRNDLHKADWVSVKIDCLDEDVCRKINRPHGSLKQEKIQDGIMSFSGSFRGELVTETMLVRDKNDGREELERIAGFISGLKTRKSYLSIPIRPPAEEWATSPDEEAVNRAYQIFSGRGIDVEYLTGYEGNAFAHTGKVEHDLLAITSVHPMREEAVTEFLRKADADRSVMDGLVAEGKIIETTYMGNRFYLRRFPRPGFAEYCQR